jgi:histidinol dehydrogenase
MRVVRGYNVGLALLDRRVSWPWEEPHPSVLASIARLFSEPLTPEQAVTRILADVRSRGDAALRDYARMLDGREPQALEVPRATWAEARSQMDPAFVRAVQQAAERVRAFHQAAMPKAWIDTARGYGELYLPLERAGLYVPGGTAPYPSTVVMTAVPARVAGVRDVVVCTPGRSGGLPHPAILAAADIVGVDRVFAVGGAQAVAAMAYGTDSVPRVDIVCGPGNLFVTLAKKLVFGHVAVDGLYGPTETVVIADETASPASCAADLLAQAEHDVLATPVFLTTSESLLARVQSELTRQLEIAPRRQIAGKALEERGVAVVVDTLEQAVGLANAFAPEHLSVIAREPWDAVPLVRNSGGVFIGDGSPEVLGDYMAGPSHVMPTGGTARFSSALGVRQFLKSVPIVAQSEESLRNLAHSIVRFAQEEGLHAHANAILVRMEEGARS